MSKLVDKQIYFTRMVARLLDKADEMGFGVTLGETWRTREQVEINILGQVGRAKLANLIQNRYPDLAKALGANTVRIASKRSLHPDRLAVDLNLFKNGNWITTPEPYDQLGRWWEQQSTTEFKLTHGRSFGDHVHFSLTHAGRR